MKFKFCSDGDCPLWALAALHALGSLPIQLFRTLLQHLLEELPDDGIMEILKDTSLASREECARAAAVLRWTLRQAHRCACPGSQLSRDLLVLGVPRAHASALGDAADATRDDYEAHVKANGFMINNITDVSAASGPLDAVDTIKLILHSHEVFTGEQESTELLVDKTQARNMLEELRNAYKRIKEMDEE